MAEVDFEKYGSIKIHKKMANDEHDVIELLPMGDNYQTRKENLKQMLDLLDSELKSRNVERGILIRNSIKYPVNCVIVFDYELY